MSMKKPKDCPVSEFAFEIFFKKYGKQYKVDCFIFKEHEDLVNYHNYIVSAGYRSVDLLAAAIFANPTKKNNNTIGGLAFAKDVLSPAIIAHEACHIAWNYFERVHGTDLIFKGRRKEETFCDIVQTIIDQVFIFLHTNNIPYKKTICTTNNEENEPDILTKD